MKTNNKVLFALLIFAISGCTKPTSNHSVGNLSGDSKVMYGDDDRNSEEQAPMELRKYKSSVGILVANSRLTQSGSKYVLSGSTNTERVASSHNEKGLCPSEKFVNEMSAGFCSGFLIAGNQFVTAGHCVEAYGIDEFKIVLGWTGEGEVPQDKVYTASRVINTANKVIALADGTYESLDFAVLQLTTSVSSFEPITLETQAESRITDPLVMIGHPTGLPMKWTDQAQIFKITDMSFGTNLDNLGGNSGSLVMNTRTGKAVGVLVSDTVINDYAYDLDGDCMKVTRVRNDFGNGQPRARVVALRYFMDPKNTVTPPSETPPSLPVPASGRSCSIQGGDERVWVYSSPDIDAADIVYLDPGTMLFVIGFEQVYFQGNSSDGVELQVLSVPNSNNSNLVGKTLYYYEILLPQICR